MATDHLTELAAALRILDPRLRSHEGYRLAQLIRDVRPRGVLWLCGNGGSFATAQHWAVDLAKVCAIRAHVLGQNGAALTAWANDDSYADAFADELDRYARHSDIVIALSCSGTSANIAAVLALAARRNLPSVLLTGDVNDETAVASHTIRIPSKDYGVVEDCFAAIGHWLTKELAQ